MVADLFIWEELARPERWEALAGLLDRLPEMYRKARERFEADYESNEVIRFFLRDQLQEMDEAPLLASLGVSSREEATPERFVQRLELRGVTVAPRPGAQEEMEQLKKDLMAAITGCKHIWDSHIDGTLSVYIGSGVLGAAIQILD